MNSRERFVETMRYGKVDRVPYFEEGIRREVIRKWRRQGLAKDADIAQMFPSDHREVIEVDLEPRPKFSKWPRSKSDLKELFRRLLPYGRGRLPRGWAKRVRSWKDRDYPLMLRIHRGFFLSMGVYDWHRFSELMDLLIDDPEFVRQAMAIQGEFAAGLAERVLREVAVDAVLFSEPIGGNYGPLISPRMYEDIVLRSYEPVFHVLGKYGVETTVLVTYANARALIPSMLKWGFNCLWACEVNVEAMDYRHLRREFGHDLRLIGGIDLDTLRRDKVAIRRELEEKVPPLIAEGGYVPLADGRVRADVPYENYVYYRQLLQKITHGQ
ncbi:MAG: uroporphyrinogen decarboxylase family protein [Deltaproteobacteria bacterium]